MKGLQNVCENVNHWQKKSYKNCEMVGRRSVLNLRQLSIPDQDDKWVTGQEYSWTGKVADTGVAGTL